MSAREQLSRSNKYSSNLSDVEPALPGVPPANAAPRTEGRRQPGLPVRPWGSLDRRRHQRASRSFGKRGRTSACLKLLTRTSRYSN